MRPVHLTRLPCLLQLVLLGIHGSAAAQATYNPTTAQFTASPDQNATLSDGRPVVQSYQLDLYYAGASAPLLVRMRAGAE